MIKVYVGTNVKRNSVIVPGNTTLRSVLEQEGINYEKGGIHLDGSSLRPGDLDKTFNDFGIKETTWLMQVVKADNA